MIQTEVGMVPGRSGPNPELDQWCANANLNTMCQFEPAKDGDEKIDSQADDSPARSLAMRGFDVWLVDITYPSAPLQVARVLAPGLCGLRQRINVTRLSRLRRKFGWSTGANNSGDLETIDIY